MTGNEFGFENVSVGVFDDAWNAIRAIDDKAVEFSKRF